MLRVLLPLLLWLPGPLLAADSCPQPLRIVSLDPDEAGRSAGVRVRELLETVSIQVVREAGLDYQTQSGPVARVLRDMEAGRADLTLMSMDVLPSLGPIARSVPMARLQRVSYQARPDLIAPARGSLAWGRVRGVALPQDLPEASSQTEATNYQALMNMLSLGRVRGIVAYRPTIDFYFREHPELQERLGPPTLLSVHVTALHLSARLPADCVARLARAADQVRRTQFRPILERLLPGADTSLFLLP